MSAMTVPVSEVCSAGLRLKPTQYKEVLNTVAVPSVERGGERVGKRERERAMST